VDERGFWRIVDGCRRAADPAEALADKLRKLGPDDIAAFDEHFCGRVDDALTWDLWAAADVLLGGCSEDELLWFRWALVGAGRATYELALENADSLAKVELVLDDRIGAVALEVYRDLTGRWIARPPARTKPQGKRWDIDDEGERRARLPRLVRRVAIDRFNELHHDGWQATIAGDREGAIAIYLRALALLEPEDRHDGIALVHGNVVANASAIGRMEQARNHFEAARRTRTHVRDLRQRAILDSQLAWYALDFGDEADCRAAVDWIHESASNAEDPLPALEAEARLLLRLGREGGARQVVKRALARDPGYGPLADLRARWAL
jgi:tetratricopeptide (TPR) repeat protein